MRCFLTSPFFVLPNCALTIIARWAVGLQIRIVSTTLQDRILGTLRRWCGLPDRVVSALFKYEPDEDDERKTYSTPDGAADHATQVVTRVADFWALIDV